MALYREIKIDRTTDEAQKTIDGWKNASELKVQFMLPPKDATTYEQRMVWEKKRDAAHNTSLLAIAAFCTDDVVRIPQYDGKDTHGAYFKIGIVWFRIGKLFKHGVLRWSITIHNSDEMRNVSPPYAVTKAWNEATTNITVSGDKAPREILADVHRRLHSTGVYLYNLTSKEMVDQAQRIAERNARIQQFRDADKTLNVRGDLDSADSSPKVSWSYSNEEAYGEIGSFYETGYVDMDLKNVPTEDALAIVKLIKERREVRNR